MHNTVI